MKTRHLWLVAGCLAAACSPMMMTPTDAGTTADGGTGTGSSAITCMGSACQIAGELTGSVSLDATKQYTMTNLVYVKDGTLTIPAGTVIKGEQPSALIVTTTGKLVAQGTASQPIVFTSALPAGQRGTPTGDWGGIVLNGTASINDMGGVNNAEGLADEARNKYGKVSGTTNDAHDCGTLKYVRIEFAGRPLSANNELNGLTLNACGSGTTVDFVQVHRGVDDGVEIFGGSVNVKHLVITGFDDDGLDWDKGWTGKGQFIVVQQTGDRGNHGIEADNNRDNRDALPRSNPTLSNVTLIGRKPSTAPSEGPSVGMILREGTAGTLMNFVVMNHTADALRIDHSNTVTQWNMGALNVKNSIFFENPMTGARNWVKSLGDGGVEDRVDEAAVLGEALRSNRLGMSPGLMAPMSEMQPNFTPASGAEAMNGAAMPPSDGFFDTSALYVGAVGGTDWTAGWTAYPQN